MQTVKKWLASAAFLVIFAWIVFGPNLWFHAWRVIVPYEPSAPTALATYRDWLEVRRVAANSAIPVVVVISHPSCSRCDATERMMERASTKLKGDVLILKIELAELTGFDQPLLPRVYTRTTFGTVKTHNFFLDPILDNHDRGHVGVISIGGNQEILDRFLKLIADSYQKAKSSGKNLCDMSLEDYDFC